MGKSHILVVDDEATQRKLISHVLETKLGFTPIPVSGGQEAIDYITSGTLPVPDVMLLDLSMPEVGGMEVIRKLRPIYPNLPIIVLTIYGDIERAVSAIKAGATDFLAKPVAHERLRTSINNALRINALSEEVVRLRRTQEGQVLFDDIIGSSQALEGAKALGAKAADSLIPILIEGEAGVGKELFARAIHGASDRAGKPFVTVNCGAMNENMVEAIFFGSERGAHSGMPCRSIGKFAEADGGTLFLDEIAELSPAMQVKLGQALQDNEIQPVGSSHKLSVNVRVISASNYDLQKLVMEKFFREDLYYQLNAFPLKVPSLAERKNDILTLAEYFLTRFSFLENKQVKGFAPEVDEILLNYSWPGNIRQLENLIFRLVVLLDHEIVLPSDMQNLLPSSYLQQFGQSGQFQNISHSRSLPLLSEGGDVRKLRDIEAGAIYFALKYYKGKISTVARKLGIGRSTLYRKMHDLGIEVH